MSVVARLDGAALTVIAARFDLRSLVREELAESAEPDPRDVAERVLNRIEDRHLRSALEACLSGYVRTVATEGRRSPVRPGRPVGRSRWDDAADQYRRFLTTRVFVGADRWVFASEMTVAGCEAAAAVNREKAAQNEVWASRWIALAGKLRTFRAETVADLPPDEVQAALR